VRRQWNTINPALAEDYYADEGHSLEVASAIAVVANPIFLDLIASTREAFDQVGGELYLSANREKLNAAGEVIASADSPNGDREAPGRWETVSLTTRFTIPGEEAELPVAIPNETSPCGLAAHALAHACDPDFLDAILTIKVALNRFGGQAYLLAHREDEETLGYVFSYEHRGADMVSAKPPEPPSEPEIEEDATEAPPAEITDEEPVASG
jgi:hypothetical protein